MNKRLIINIVIFAAGAGVGFLVAKKVYEEYYANLAQEEIDSVKEVFSKNAVDARDNSCNPNGMTDEEYAEWNKEQQVRTNNNPLTRSSILDNPYEQVKRNYHLESVKKKNPEPTEEFEEDPTVRDAAGCSESEYEVLITERNMDDVDRTMPYVISDSEYSNDFTHHDKISLYYYTDDDTLTEENEDIILDIDNTVGWECFKVLETQTTAWVRNEPLAVDYEICSVRGSYAEIVHGIYENSSPRERYNKMKRRPKIED